MHAAPPAPGLRHRARDRHKLSDAESASILQVVRPSRPRHELRPLIDAFEELLREHLHTALPAQLKDDLLLFATVDPDAQGFRYSHTPAGQPRPLPGEYWVPLRDLRRFADEVFGFIEDALRRLPR